MIDTEHGVERYISAYSERTGALVRTIDLRSFDLARFQAQFRIADHADPMYACYPIGADDIPFIRRYVGTAETWDFAAFSYFLEATRLPD